MVPPPLPTRGRRRPLPLPLPPNNRRERALNCTLAWFFLVKLGVGGPSRDTGGGGAGLPQASPCISARRPGGRARPNSS
jgi:hypothetical protein